MNQFISVLVGPRQADEPAGRAERQRAAAQVHGQVLHPGPEPAGGGVHPLPVQPPGEARPRSRPPPVQRQHRCPHGLLHSPG